MKKEDLDFIFKRYMIPNGFTGSWILTSPKLEGLMEHLLTLLNKPVVSQPVTEVEHPKFEHPLVGVNPSIIIDEIYNLYPTKCPVSKRSTGKSLKNKDKIRTILKKMPADELSKTIRHYINDCIRDGVYIKNFATFLNNLPDYSAPLSPTERTDEDIYLTEEERKNPDDNVRQRLIYERKFDAE